jgi:hypothetical protein
MDRGVGMERERVVLISSPVLTVLFWVSCPDCPVPVVLS